MRWGAVVFCVVQFAAYSPAPGAVPPVALLPVGLALAVVLAAINVLDAAVQRRRPRAPVGLRPGRRDLALLGVDTALVGALVLLFAFDPSAALWALLIVPVLEAGLLGGLGLSLATWAACAIVLAARELVAWQVFGVMSSTSSALVSSFAYRGGLLLLVAVIVGSQSGIVRGYLEQLQAAHRRLAHEAQHDHLTGAAERVVLVERAQAALASGTAGGVAVLYLDCDRFKQVNDTYGHAAGDAVLREVVRRTGLVVRAQDTVARLGGDEFAVLLVDLAAGEAAVIADRARRALAHPYALEGRLELVWMTCSVGLAVASDAGSPDVPGEEAVARLLHRADLAMYVGKGSGGPAPAPGPAARPSVPAPRSER